MREDEDVVDLGVASALTQGTFMMDRRESIIYPDTWD